MASWHETPVKPTTGRCECCHFPTIGRRKPLLCSKCVMIAHNERYSDGSDPGKGLSKAERAYIAMRVRSIQRQSTTA